MPAQSHTPRRAFRAAPNDRGLRTHEDDDELVHHYPHGDVRIALNGGSQSHSLRCFTSVSENSLRAIGLELSATSPWKGIL